MRKLIATIPIIAAVTVAVVLSGPRPAEACAGLIGSNGTVNLGRTTTLAAYSGGVEHYVTSFQFLGGGGEFGSLIPLPGVPTKVERGGDWTLQRLQRETPVRISSATGGGGPVSSGGVSVLQEVRIDALDITVLEGGGPDVAAWATEHGFRLSPDAPEVLDFYARRSSIFLAAVYDTEAAAERGQRFGDGTPVHITIPTDNPWVPLRILGLGKQANDFVSADVFLLTDEQPAFLPAAADGLSENQPSAFAPAAGNGLILTYYGEASDLLLDDLRSDAGMGWMPESAWLTKIQVGSSARNLRYDLAVDASGEGKPSLEAAGLIPLPDTGGHAGDGSNTQLLWAVVVASLGILITFVAMGLQQRRRGH